MNNDVLEYLINKITESYNCDESDNRGCYCNGKWLSVYDIVEIIKEVDEEY